MDNARSRHTADAAQLARAMMQQRVHQRVLLIARRWMHDETRRLVQDEQRLVLEYDIERDVLGFGFGWFGLGPFDADDFADARAMRGFGLRAIDGDVALLDEPLNRAA